MSYSGGAQAKGDQGSKEKVLVKLAWVEALWRGGSTGVGCRRRCCSTLTSSGEGEWRGPGWRASGNRNEGDYTLYLGRDGVEGELHMRAEARRS